MTWMGTSIDPLFDIIIPQQFSDFSNTISIDITFQLHWSVIKKWINGGTHPGH